jgi:hypothetical protein
MAARLKVILEPPQHGWLQLTLRSDEQALVILASYVPFDVLTAWRASTASLMSSTCVSCALKTCFVSK